MLFVFNAKCSVLDGTSIANLLLLLRRLRDHCRMTVRVRGSGRHGWKQWSSHGIRTAAQDLGKLKPAQSPAWRWGIDTESCTLAKQLVSVALIGHPTPVEGRTSKSKWAAQIVPYGLKKNRWEQSWEEGIDLGGVRKRSKYDQNILIFNSERIKKWEGKQYNLALRRQEDQKFKANSKLLDYF